MRRTLAIAIAVLLPATAAVAEPLDIDLGQLGAPAGDIWTLVGTNPNAARLADESKARFGMLASELALSLTTSLLTPGSTTGHSGFDIALEGGYAATHTNVVGTQTGDVDGTAFAPRNFWPTRGLTPNELFVPAIRIRKALPFSVELGGRFKYVSQSALYAGQLETKWAFFEGDRVLPDFALRVAFTKIGGVRALNISATDVDFVVSKRFGVLGVVSLTPYGAMRFTFMRASSDPLVFFPEAAVADNPGTTTVNEAMEDQIARTAAFPKLSSTFFRSTLGVRMTTYALSLAAEITHFGGGEYDPDGYPVFRVKPSLAGSFRLGFEF